LTWGITLERVNSELIAGAVSRVLAPVLGHDGVDHSAKRGLVQRWRLIVVVVGALGVIRKLVRKSVS
jgi:hypothetical protein